MGGAGRHAPPPGLAASSSRPDPASVRSACVESAPWRRRSNSARCRPTWPGAIWPRVRGTTAHWGSSSATNWSRTATGRSGSGRPPTPTSGTVGEVYEEARARGRRPAGPRARPGRHGGLPAAQLGGGGGHLLRLRHARGDLGARSSTSTGPRRSASSSRQSQARALIVAAQIGKRDMLAELATDTRRTRRPRARDRRRRRRLGVERRGRPVVRRAADGPSRSRAPSAVDPDGPALIGYTSGTTADPKGVVHTHRTLGCEVRQLAGMQVAARPARARRCPGRARHRDARRPAVPARQRQAHLPDRRVGPADRPRRHGGGADRGGQRLDVLLHQPARLPRLRARARGAHEVRRPRGLAHPRTPWPSGRTSSGSRWCAPTGAPSTPRSPGPCTRPLGRSASTPTGCRWRGWRSARSTRTGNDVGVGEPGEILSRGPDRFAGYTDPVLTAESLDAEGWFRTGDVGVIDDDGYLTITDRVKDIIIRGGENVSAAEVEQLLAHMDGSGRGGGGRGARRAPRGARVRLLPHAARGRGRPTSRRCAPIWTRPAWPARSGPRSCAWSTNCRGRRRARCRSSCCARRLRAGT